MPGDDLKSPDALYRFEQLATQLLQQRNRKNQMKRRAKAVNDDQNQTINTY